ncbi:MAG: uroporphyrinogen-III C-methyltransferase [Pseudomonadota bacterium]
MEINSSGTVYLVGAGPGDPDLLTLRAARLIAAAELIVHDGLVDDAILAMARPDARLVSVAKSRSRHSMPQDQINALLVQEALAGRDVVRLKGGDPFIFGRGGEEAEDCRAAGVRVEIVPGISAAIGCAAQAQIPLTHRDASSAVTFVAGQCKGLTDQDWSGLAGVGRTLVIYMGVATANDIADKLIADGVSPGTPVAVLEKGTRHDARAMRTLLADLGGMIAREQVQSPALIVVGDVVLRGNAEDRLGSYLSAVRPELVEGLSFFENTQESGGLGFDRLSPNGDLL